MPLRALVTGGAGFIGSHLVDALLGRGEEVVVIDDLSVGKRANIEAPLARGMKLVEADLRDGGKVANALLEFEPQLVFHLAAQVDVRASVAYPAIDAAVNVIGTANVLEAARRSGARRVLFASTGGAIYGEGEGRDLPFAEDAQCSPEAPYGQSKLAAEGYCRLYERLHGLSASCLRFGNVYGPRQDLVGEAGVIAMFSYRLLDGRQPTVYGDGLQTRDYTYVDDVVSGMLAAADLERPTGIFNLGTGVETTVLELVDALAAAGERPDFTPQMAPARQGEIQRTVLSTSLSEAVLGWRAQIQVAAGLRRTLDWARSVQSDGDA